jgi:hypothetical protein
MFDPSKAGTAYSTKVSVIAGTWYSFSFYAKNLNPKQVNIPSPIINVSLNGVQYFSDCDTITSNSWTGYDTVQKHVMIYGAADWKKISGCWYSGSSTTLTFKIYYCEAQETGFDLGIDDISINECSGPLPIELISFFCKDYVLHWITASETNSDCFIISNAGNDFNFKDIAQVKAVGQSIVEQRYSYQIKDGRYYALSERDFDGTRTRLALLYVNPQGDNEPLNYYNILGQRIK